MLPSLPFARRPLPPTIAASAACVASLIAGCIPPQYAARDADRAAYDIIEQKQQAALGRTEPFTIELPEDQLRRKLMLDQHLPAAGPASFGRAFLPPVPKEPEGVSENLPLPPEAEVVDRPAVRVTGVNALNLSTDIFLAQIGSDPTARRPDVSDPPGTGIVLGPPAPTAEPLPPLLLTLLDALQVGARNSRQYQAQKEQVYLTALALDLERDQFEFRFAGTLDADVAADFEGQDTAGVVVTPALGVDKVFKSGAILSTRIGLDLARLLTGDGGESLGVIADASLTIPLLRGAGVEVVTEPLQQAERDAIYAIWDFERFKRTFAVDVTRRYYNVLQSLDQITNARATYERLRENSARSRALYEEGRLPAVQVDQVVSNQINARERVILAEQRYEQQLDEFKVFLGLPADARVVLDTNELRALEPLAERVLGPVAERETAADFARGGAVGTGDAPATEPDRDLNPGADAPLDPEARRERDARLDQDALDEAISPTTQPGPTTGPDVTLPEPVDPADINERLGEDADVEVPGVATELADATSFYDKVDVEYRAEAIRIALANRLDLAVTYGGVADAQRVTVVAADRLNAVLDLVGSADYSDRRGAFSGGAANGQLRFDEGSYRLGLRLDLPIERTAERNQYRQSLIALDRAVRAAQEAEDNVKLDVLRALRDLRVAAEDLKIQALAIEVAQRRVELANALLNLGRGETRDVTEAEQDLVNAQDSFTRSLVDFRLAELELRRDLGVLEVDETGLYAEAPLFETRAQ